MAKPTGLGNRMASVELNDKIEELTEEVERLKQTSGVQKIPVDKIAPDPNQPRRTFPERLIAKRAKSLAENGQETPIILIHQPNGRYVLFDGEVRWRAAKTLDWTHLDAVIKVNSDIDPIDLFKGQLTTAIQSEQLHPLDLAEAIVKIAATDGKIDVDKIPRILDTFLKRASRDNKLSEISDLLGKSQTHVSEWIETSQLINNPEEAIVLSILLELQLNPKSVATNILPMLSLPAELKAAIRESDLDASKAVAISRLTAEKLNISPADALALRTSTIAETVDDHLSLSAVRAKCKQRLPCNAKSDKSSGKIAKSISAIDLDTLSVAEIDDLSQLLELKLNEIRARKSN